MTDDLQNLLTWHNGEKAYSPFTDEEMAGRQAAMRAEMERVNLDACLFTSYHNIFYFSNFLYCVFGRLSAISHYSEGEHERMVFPGTGFHFSKVTITQNQAPPH